MGISWGMYRCEAGTVDISLGMYRCQAGMIRDYLGNSIAVNQGRWVQDYFTNKVCSVGKPGIPRDVTQGNPLRPSP